MRNAVLMVFRISIFCRTFAAETFAIVKLYIKLGRSMVIKKSDYGQQYKEYTNQAAGDKAYIVGAQVLGGELWFN